MKDYEEDWNDFWRDLVTDEDGTINLDLVKRELSDFRFVMTEVPKVYSHVTGGALSKPNYYASGVISAFDNYLEEVRAWTIEDFLSDYDIEDPRK
jgi:hypothetical protein